MNEVTTDMKPGEPIMGNVTGCKNLNIRQEPDGEANILGTIPVGSEVMIDESESTDDFYRIYAESGVEGFCMKKFIAVQ